MESRKFLAKIFILIANLSLNCTYCMEFEELEEIINMPIEIEMEEITDKNRFKFFGKPEEFDFFGDNLENIFDNDQNFWDNLQDNLNIKTENNKEILYKTLNKKDQKDFFPLFNLPNDIIIFIASLLVNYKDISAFLRTCKKFYLLRSRIDLLVLQKLSQITDNKFLEDKLAQHAKYNPNIDIPHIATVYENMTWLTTWAIKNRQDKFFKNIIDTKDTLLRTPLHYAAYYNKHKIAYMLVKLGATLESRDFLGNTPLHITTFRASMNTAQILLELGADPNTKNDRKRTPLHELAFKDNFEMVRLLLNYNAAPNSKDNLKRTPLHEAAIKNSFKSANILLQYCSNPNAQDTLGETPLHESARFGSNEVARLLLRSGAKDDITNWSMEKPSHVAYLNNYHSLAQEIENHDKNCNII